MAHWPKGDPAAVLKARLKPGEGAIDVGAANGTVTRAMAEAVGPSGLVWALEPDPRWHIELMKLQRELPQVRPLVVAAHDDSCEVVLYQCSDGTRNSLHAGTPGMGTTTAARVGSMRLNRWFLVSPIAAVKIDAQGNEAAILRGAGELLAACPFWVIEIWPAGLRAAGASAVEVHRVLTQAGLTVRAMNEQVLDEAEMGRMDAAYEGQSHCNVTASR